MLLLLPLAHAGDLMDVWVTTAFEDDNLLAGPSAYSPAANFVTRGNSTFFENYESRFTDDISQSWLVLYRQDDGFHPNWFTESAFVLRLAPSTNPNDSSPTVKISDDGSYVRLGYRFGGDKDNTLSLTGYAVDANRFRLGYSYDLTWGGRDVFAFDPNAAPGVRLQYQKNDFYAFAGAKTAVGDYKDPETAEPQEQAYYGALAGLGGQIGQQLRVEGGFGTFQQGQLTNAGPTAATYLLPINALGGSAQVAFRTNPDMNWITSNELKLYRNAPDYVKDTYIHHRQLDGWGLLVQAEGNLLAHNLMDFENPDSTVVEKAFAGDVQAVLAFGSTEIAADFVYKDLAYIVFNVPGITSGYSISDQFEVTPQIYGRLRAAHYFPEAHITPSLGVGWMQAATYGVGGSYYVKPSERDTYNVPDGQVPTALLSSVAGVQWDVSKSVVGVGEVLYTLNNNLSDFVIDEEGGEGQNVLAAENERNQLGFNLIVRARF